MPIAKQQPARFVDFNYITQIDHEGSSFEGGKRDPPCLLQFPNGAIRNSSCYFKTERRWSIMHVVIEIILCWCRLHAIEECSLLATSFHHPFH